MIDITKYVEMAVKKSCAKNGICVIYVPHTTAGVTINENVNPDVCDDIIFHLNTLIPNLKTFKHFERNSDSHLKTSKKFYYRLFKNCYNRRWRASFEKVARHLFL